MPIKITFELSDGDLEYFRDVFRKAQDTALKKDEATILHQARRQAREMRGRKIPEFVESRLECLDALTRMMEDAEWGLAGPHRARVFQALAYFADPADLIPDQIPGLGYLDDAIMVELVVQELRPELDAYDAFCRFRDEEQKAKTPADVLQKKLATRRRAMYARMEKRRDQRARRGGFFSIFR